MNLQIVGRIAMKIGGVLASVSPILITNIVNSKIRNKPVTYDDVIGHIMRSSMLGSDKSEMISVIKRDDNQDVYRSIIHVVNSSMLGSEKIKIVKQLCE